MKKIALSLILIHGLALDSKEQTNRQKWKDFKYHIDFIEREFSNNSVYSRRRKNSKAFEFYTRKEKSDLRIGDTVEFYSGRKYIAEFYPHDTITAEWIFYKNRRIVFGGFYNASAMGWREMTYLKKLRLINYKRHRPIYRFRHTKDDIYLDIIFFERKEIYKLYSDETNYGNYKMSFIRLN